VEMGWSDKFLGDIHALHEKYKAQCLAVAGLDNRDQKTVSALVKSMTPAPAFPIVASPAAFSAWNTACNSPRASDATEFTERYVALITPDGFIGWHGNPNDPAFTTELQKALFLLQSADSTTASLSYSAASLGNSSVFMMSRPAPAQTGSQGKEEGPEAYANFPAPPAAKEPDSAKTSSSSSDGKQEKKKTVEQNGSKPEEKDAGSPQKEKSEKAAEQQTDKKKKKSKKDETSKTGLVNASQSPADLQKEAAKGKQAEIAKANDIETKVAVSSSLSSTIPAAEAKESDPDEEKQKTASS